MPKLLTVLVQHPSAPECFLRINAQDYDPGKHILASSVVSASSGEKPDPKPQSEAKASPDPGPKANQIETKSGADSASSGPAAKSEPVAPEAVSPPESELQPKDSQLEPEWTIERVQAIYDQAQAEGRQGWRSLKDLVGDGFQPGSGQSWEDAIPAIVNYLNTHGS
jgi:hypothetical protein